MTEIAVIGAGPAGITAAIQLKRYGFGVRVFEKDRTGGLLWNANLVENYPGFPNGVSGPKLVALMEKQLQIIGVSVTHAEVKLVDWQNEQFHLHTQPEIYRSDFLIVATGTKSKRLPIDIPAGAAQHISSDMLSLLEVTKKHITIVGAGDAAFDYALNLSKKVNSVTILNRGHDVKCLPLLFDRVMAEPAIAYHRQTVVREIALAETDDELLIRAGSGEQQFQFQTDHLLFAIGRIPVYPAMSDTLVKMRTGLEKRGKLFFIGDLVNGLMRQTTISAGDGMRAAMQIYFTLNTEARLR